MAESNNKSFVIYKKENGVKLFLYYTSIVGEHITGTDINEAKVFIDGNMQRQTVNQMNKQAGFRLWWRDTITKKKSNTNASTNC